MTVIMAIKKDGEIWVGADRRINYDHFIVDPTQDQDSKLVHLNHAIIGGAGDITIRNFLELFVSRGVNKEFLFSGKLSVMEFFISFKKFLKRHAGLGDADSNQVQNLQNTDWLIATRTHLFEMNEDGGILDTGNLCVVGCGQLTARPILSYLMENHPELSAEEMLRRAYKIVLRYDGGCGGDLQVVNLTKTLG